MSAAVIAALIQQLRPGISPALAEEIARRLASAIALIAEPERLWAEVNGLLARLAEETR